MPLVRPPLRFRHVFGEPARRDECFEGIPISRATHDGRLTACNPSLLAVTIESAGGGSIAIVPISKPGRYEFACLPRLCGHSGPIIDVDWNPFDDLLLSTASEDATVSF
ncbi:unnamed protein product [Protopolystoma xenopodis]|uniref:DUF1899 domain-containing protein n=1 Tax=Protopolystoma xenopodis TaxID=117903 RepID=A0A3S5CRA4_9PLAT|nr:unnamed protein product [Protopolystoma xenopodis]